MSFVRYVTVHGYTVGMLSDCDPVYDFIICVSLCVCMFLVSVSYVYEVFVNFWSIFYSAYDGKCCCCCCYSHVFVCYFLFVEFSLVWYIRHTHMFVRSFIRWYYIHPIPSTSIFILSRRVEYRTAQYRLKYWVHVLRWCCCSCCSCWIYSVSINTM